MKKVTSIHEANAVLLIWRELCEKASKSEGSKFDEILLLKKEYEPRYESAKRFFEHHNKKR